MLFLRWRIINVPVTGKNETFQFQVDLKGVWEDRTLRKLRAINIIYINDGGKKFLNEKDNVRLNSINIKKGKSDTGVKYN